MSDGAKKAKVGFYQDPEDTARARAVFQWTNAAEQHGAARVSEQTRARLRAGSATLPG
jgi:citrate lyase beta subunit